MKLDKEQTIEAAQTAVKLALVALPPAYTSVGSVHRAEVFEALATMAAGIVQANSPQEISEIPSDNLRNYLLGSTNCMAVNIESIVGGMIDQHWKDPRAEMKSLLYSLDVQTLASSLMSIYDCSNCDEHNQYNPEESTAAHSAADFVDAVEHIFGQIVEKRAQK